MRSERMGGQKKRTALYKEKGGICARGVVKIKRGVDKKRRQGMGAEKEEKRENDIPNV